MSDPPTDVITSSLSTVDMTWKILFVIDLINVHDTLILFSRYKILILRIGSFKSFLFKYTSAFTLFMSLSMSELLKFKSL